MGNFLRGRDLLLGNFLRGGGICHMGNLQSGWKTFAWLYFSTDIVKWRYEYLYTYIRRYDLAGATQYTSAYLIRPLPPPPTPTWLIPPPLLHPTPLLIPHPLRPRALGFPLTRRILWGEGVTMGE